MDFTEYESSTFIDGEFKLNGGKSKNPILVVYSEHHRPMYFFINDLESWKFEGEKWINPNA